MRQIILFLICLTTFSSAAIAQENAPIVIIRDTDYQASLVRFSTFINKEFVHKIRNRTVTNLEVTSGKSRMTMQII